MTSLNCMVHIPNPDPGQDDPSTRTYDETLNPFLSKGVALKTFGPADFESHPTPQKNWRHAKHNVAAAWVAALNQYFGGGYSLADPVTRYTDAWGGYGWGHMEWNIPLEQIALPDGSLFEAGLIGYCLGNEAAWANTRMRDWDICGWLQQPYLPPTPTRQSISELLIAVGLAVAVTHG